MVTLRELLEEGEPDILLLVTDILTELFELAPVELELLLSAELDELVLVTLRELLELEGDGSLHELLELELVLVTEIEELVLVTEALEDEDDVLVTD